MSKKKGGMMRELKKRAQQAARSYVHGRGEASESSIAELLDYFAASEILRVSAPSSKTRTIPRFLASMPMMYVDCVRELQWQMLDDCINENEELKRELNLLRGQANAT